MKFQYLADLHLEFKDNKQWVKDNIKPVADYLLIAGDTGYLTDKRDDSLYETHCDDFLKFCRDNWKTTILIPGNHEYYGGYPLYGERFPSIDSENKIFNNVILINNDYYNFKGDEYDVKLFGTTLWSYIKPEEYEEVYRTMNDYRLCQYKDGVTLDPGHTIHEHLKAYSALQRFSYRPRYNYVNNLPNKDTKKPYKLLVMTHHGCHPDCIAECYRSSKVNSAYMSDLSKLIDGIKPDVWIYGHTHQTKSFEYNGVRIVENSLGYVEYDGCKHFNKEAIVEV